LLRLMGDPRLRDAIRLDAVVATVDGVNGLANLADRPVAANQAGVADRRLITKAISPNRTRLKRSHDVCWS
jgi:G3E family GTPase